MICTECNRNVIGSEKCPLCNAETKAAVVSKIQPNGFSNRPGTALASIIPKWAAKQRKGCSCKSYQKKMDAWGTEGCKKMFDNIVEHLTSQQSLLIAPLRVLPKSLTEYGARTLVKRAIDLSIEDRQGDDSLHVLDPESVEVDPHLSE